MVYNNQQTADMQQVLCMWTNFTKSNEREKYEVGLCVTCFKDYHTRLVICNVLKQQKNVDMHFGNFTKNTKYNIHTYTYIHTYIHT